MATCISIEMTLMWHATLYHAGTIDYFCWNQLTHWGRVTHICVVDLTIIGSDNGLLPGRLQAIICTNAGILLIGPLETNFSEIVIEIQTFSLKKMRLKMSSAKSCSFRLGLNVLIVTLTVKSKDLLIASVAKLWETMNLTGSIYFFNIPWAA